VISARTAAGHEREIRKGGGQYLVANEKFLLLDLATGPKYSLFAANENSPRRRWSVSADLLATGSTVGAAQSPRFKLFVLGQFRLIGGRGPVDLGNKKLSGLMAFLARARVPQRREKLMGLFWGSHFEPQAQQNLRKALSRLRSALGEDVFAHGEELVSLRPGAITCDADAFERLIEESSRESLRSAIALYKDIYLADVSIQEEGWLAWLSGERNRLEGLAVNALVSLAEMEERAGDLQRALELAGRAVAIDEFREDGHRLIIRCLAAAGRRAEAFKRYDQLAALLRRELDIEPDASTRSLIDTLRLPAPGAEGQVESKAPRRSDGSRPASVEVLSAAPARAAPPSDSERAAPSAEHPIRSSRAAMFGGKLRRFAPLGIPLPAAIVPTLGAAVFLMVAGVAAVGVTLAMRAGDARPTAAAWDAVPIAVLPFTGPSDGTDSRLVAGVITDDLINILSRVLGLRVISRQASQPFESRRLDFSAIGRELAVRYVVDGSVRIQSNKLRVNVELIAADTRLQVWSDYFERERADGGTGQDEIVRGIVRSLQVEVIKAEGGRLAQHQSGEPEINELVSAGWAAMFGNASDYAMAQAEKAFREALRRDPERLRAMLGLAGHHIEMVGNMRTPEREPYLSEAEELLEAILKRNPQAAAPYFYLGILHKLRGELAPALDSFEHSTTLNPSFAPGYAHKGAVLTRLGRMDEALEQIRYAMRLSPKDPKMRMWVLFAGWAELERGHDEAAFEWLFRALALNPESAQANASLAAAYALTGDGDNAAKYAAKFRQLTPGFSDQQRLEGFGARSKNPATPHRLLDGCRLALAASS
jgi:DNA-binding SARP family transcriptional activator/TolB-like protein/Tfp pilus assembly protein PilF